MEEFNNWERILEKAKQLVYDAGMQIRSSFKNQVKVDFKENRSDLVTNMDRQIEQFFIKHINELYPSHRILGEEGYGDEITSLDGTVWIIDPIDGTMNFVHMQRHFGISVGIYHNGVGMIGIIYDVVSDDLYVAIKGKGAFLNDERLPLLQSIDIGEAVIGLNAAWAIENERIDGAIIPRLLRDVRGSRSFGAATIEMAYVASGKTDGYISLRLSPWDIAAGKIIIEEVGGVVTALNGRPIHLLDRQTPILAAKAGLHEYIVNHYFLDV